MFAFVYKAALARSAKREPDYIATIHVVPSATKAFGPPDVSLVEHGYSLAMEALRKIDPEIAAMHVTPLGEPGFTTYGESTATEPALVKNGWQVFIGWKL